MADKTDEAVRMLKEYLAAQWWAVDGREERDEAIQTVLAELERLTGDRQGALDARVIELLLRAEQAEAEVRRLKAVVNTHKPLWDQLNAVEAERDKLRDTLLSRHGGEPLALLEELDEARERLRESLKKLKAAEAFRRKRLEAALKPHRPVHNGYEQFCAECRDQKYPCPTRKALTGGW